MRVGLPDSDVVLDLTEAERLVREAVDSGRMERAPALRLAQHLSDPRIRDTACEAARESKLRHKGELVTVSRNVFIPLTNLCRDRCGYCTFAKQPDSPEAKTYGLDEVADVVRGGVATGCTEAHYIRDLIESIGLGF